MQAKQNAMMVRLKKAFKFIFCSIIAKCASERLDQQSLHWICWIWHLLLEVLLVDKDNLEEFWYLVSQVLVDLRADIAR